MHLSLEWNQIGWFTLVFLLNDILLDMKQLDMRLQKLLDGIKVQQVFLFRILTIKKEGRSTIYEKEYMMILKKARLGPSDLKKSKVYINFSNNNSTWALSQHTLTVAH